jgi:hypothetical protein
MSYNSFAPDFAPAPIPVGEVLPWVLLGALLLLVLYFVGAEEGATSIIPGTMDVTCSGSPAIEEECRGWSEPFSSGE